MLVSSGYTVDLSWPRPMRVFEYREVKEAIAYALEGGQALHRVRNPPESLRARAPLVFRQAKEWAHLIDHDLARLKKTARRLGIRKICVDRVGQRGQHVDLCGEPLRKAIIEAETEALADRRIYGA
jgi:hypothetical protein